MSSSLAHGVLMQIEHLGVFICGPAGIGKSTLALELLDRGHQLIADDAIHFKLTHSHVTGYCPAMLKGFLALRDLGVLDINKLYGPHAYRPCSKLDIVISLGTESVAKAPQLDVVHGEYRVLERPFPLIKVIAVKYRNVALVIETAVKNYILYKQGNDANRQLSEKQQYYI